MDSLINLSGIKSISRGAMLKVTPEIDENAYTFPGGHIYFTIALYKRLNCDSELLLAVLAHESAHFVLQHAFCRAYDLGKKIKKAKLVASISTAVLATAGAVADINMAQVNGGNANLTQAGIDTGIALGEAAVQKAERSNFIYSRQQEIEADLLAYQFLKFTGHDPHKIIEALELLDSDLEIFYTSGDHPLTKDRIALLEYYDSGDWVPSLERLKKMDDYDPEW